MSKPTQKEFDLNWLLQPARAFARPADVLKDPDLTLYEKRAILASWASDACAVENAPALRQPTGAPPVTFDEVMDTLMQLDGPEVEKPSYGKLMTRAQRLKAIFEGDPLRSPGSIILKGPDGPSRRRRGSDESQTA